MRGSAVCNREPGYGHSHAAADLENSDLVAAADRHVRSAGAGNHYRNAGVGQIERSQAGRERDGLGLGEDALGVE